VDRSVAEIMLRVSKLLQKLTDRVKNLEDMAHPPRTFVTCESCKDKIRDKDG